MAIIFPRAILPTPEGIGRRAREGQFATLAGARNGKAQQKTLLSGLDGRWKIERAHVREPCKSRLCTAVARGVCEDSKASRVVVQAKLQLPGDVIACASPAPQTRPNSARWGARVNSRVCTCSSY